MPRLATFLMGIQPDNIPATYLCELCTSIVLTPPPNPSEAPANVESTGSLDGTRRKRDKITATKLWVEVNLKEDVDSRVSKLDLWLRYSQYINESDQGGVTEVTLKKYLLQIFPSCKSSRSRGNAFYQGIRWTDEEPFVPP